MSIVYLWMCAYVNVRCTNVFNSIYMYLMNYSPDVIWMDVALDTQNSEPQVSTTHLAGVWQHRHSWHGTHSRLPWLQVVLKNFSKSSSFVVVCVSVCVCVCVSVCVSEFYKRNMQ